MAKKFNNGKIDMSMKPRKRTTNGAKRFGNMGSNSMGQKSYTKKKYRGQGR